MRESITIQKKPVLPDNVNYELLRTTGMEYIKQLGSAGWTDYNLHDPGITLLELLCYALTDLGYRTSLPVKDLIAQPLTQKPAQDYRRQAFYTAREILTVSPWTEADYRKLLIDVDGVKNAWPVCKQACACDGFDLYIHCRESKLSYTPPKDEVPHHTLRIKGFYDVLIELEEDRTGDLNSGKIFQNFQFPLDAAGERAAKAVLEMRFPSWQDFRCQNEWDAFRKKARTIQSIAVLSIAKVKGTGENINQDELGRALRRPLYVDLDIQFEPLSGEAPADVKLHLKDVPINVWFGSADERNALKRADLEAVITNTTTVGVAYRYFEKLLAAEAVIKKATGLLHNHRNLCEDFCRIHAVRVKDVGVCADMEVKTDADIEQVLAQAYYLIDQYFSPDIKFYSLKELLAAGKPVDEIFEGPPLDNGFIDNEQLEKTNLKNELRTSDIINLLMDIPGVVAVRNLVLVSYDKDGKNTGSEPWVLRIEPGYQPRFYALASKFLVFKNNLPFLPDSEELSDTLQVIKGKARQAKLPLEANDLPVPEGTYYDLRDYYPVQYSLPFTYGVGYEGLPAQASAERKAQAKQLKAFLLFFEQLLAAYLEQLAHLADLFATDAGIEQTYFSRLFNEDDIRNISAIQNGLTQTALNSLVEDRDTYLDRKNRFLDHLMARFGEQFTDYALMLYSYTGSGANTEKKLVKDKAAFLTEIPSLSFNRGRSFNYKDETLVCNANNVAGLQQRIRTLLGIQPLNGYFETTTVKNETTGHYESTWKLEDDKGATLLVSNGPFADPLKEEAEKKAKLNMEAVLQNIHTDARYEITGGGTAWSFQLRDAAAAIIAAHPKTFKKESSAKAQKDALIKFADTIVASEKIFIVEHILIRPHHKPEDILKPFPPPGYSENDSLLPVCVADDCEFCGEEDPYSFRLTIVMNGNGGLANAGIAFRRFAEQTIRKEVPAHLGVKICWVPDKDDSNIDLTHFKTAWCDYLAELAKEAPVPLALYNKLVAFLKIFKALKSVYPPASLHDCADGNDENRVYLNQTILGKNKKDTP